MIWKSVYTLSMSMMILIYYKKKDFSSLLAFYSVWVEDWLKK